MLTVKRRSLLVPPPGAGLTTRALRAPVPAAAPMVTLAVIWVALLTTVEFTVMPEPEKDTVEPGTKFVPVNVSVTVSPRTALAGETVVRSGSGLSPDAVNAIGLPRTPGAVATTELLFVPAACPSIHDVSAATPAASVSTVAGETGVIEAPP